MQNRRHTGAIFTLIVYIVAMCAPALLSLTCECTAQHREYHACCLDHAAERHSAECCSGKDAHEDTIIGDFCHCSRHAISTQLYTATDAEQRSVRTIVFELLPQIGGEAPEMEAPTVRRYRHRQHPTPFIAGGAKCSRGLRAPPVSA